MANNNSNQGPIMIDAGLKKHWKNKRRLRFAVALAILLIIVGGFFYWSEMLIKRDQQQRAAEEKADQERRMALVPVLFSKDDYRVEDRSDGKYIIVDKVGLTCKVPNGWGVEIQEATSSEKNEGWVTLNSADMETVHGVLSKGCSVSLRVGKDIDGNQNTKKILNILKGGEIQDSSLIKKDYNYKIKKIGDTEAMEWFAPKYDQLGQGVGIGIPFGDSTLIDIATRFPNANPERCSLAWQEFIQNISLK